MTITYRFSVFSVGFLLACILLLSSCVSKLPQQEKTPKSLSPLQVKLSQYQQSDFKQVEATFSTGKSKELVFRVISDIEQTPQWLDRLDSLEILTSYNHHQYLLRTIIASPWPFKDRELITCVNTDFNKTETTIKVFSCSDRVPVDEQYVRILDVRSSWTITETSSSMVEINYKAWLDPSGNVPVFIFNSALIDNAKISLKQLQIIIENASLAQYWY